jgi:hypothetical protein
MQNITGAMKNLFAFALLISFQSLLAQVPTFERTYNDTANLAGNASRAVELDSGNYYIASSGYSLFVEEGGFQRLHSFDDSGNILLNNFKYDQSRRFSSFCSMIKSFDGNLLLFNTRSKVGGIGGNQIFVLKVSPNLSDTIWSYYHRDSIYYDTPQDLIETPTGDFALVASRGYFDSEAQDGYFVRLNSQGQLLSDALINEDFADSPNNIVYNNGDYLIGGTSGNSFAINELHEYLVCIDENGIRQDGWQIPQLTEAGMSQFGQDKLLFSGYKYQGGGPKAVMTNLEGIVLYNKTYSGFNAGAASYIGRRVSDGGIVHVGIFTPSPEINNAGMVFKTDSLGNMLWSKYYNHGNWADYFIDFIETMDGGLLISGAADDDFCCGVQNAWVVKLDADGCLDPANCGVGIEDAPFPDAVTIYPNPATDWLRIDLETAGSAYTAQLLDATGRLVQNEVFSALGTHTLSLSNLATGIYYCRILQNGEIVTTEKVLKME